jgi:hypothetical protein
MFGDPEVMPAKVIWDYAYYWGILCQFFFQRRLTDIAVFSRLKRELVAVQELNLSIQALLREWSKSGQSANPPRMLDQAALPWFAELNRSLTDSLDDNAFDERIRRNAALLHELAAEICERAGPTASAAPIAAVQNLIAAFAGAARQNAEMLFRPAA